MKIEMKWGRLLDIRVILMIIFIVPLVLINKEVNNFVIGLLFLNTLSYLMDIVEALREINSNIKED